MVKVGAATETEMKEKKARVEDALHATRAAVEEGIVPGGGVALIRAQTALDKPQGRRRAAVRRATSSAARIEEPLRQIAQNAGLEGSIVVNKVREGKGDFGYNAATDQYGDLLAHGRHRPGQGRALRAAERGQRREPHAHDRVPRRRAPEGREGGGGGGHAGHGHGDF